MRCIRCGSVNRRRDGYTRLGGQRWRCNECRRRFTARSSSAFSRRWFTDEVIALATRWYVRYRLSYADVAEWLAERGVMVSRSTIYRWVQRFLPLFAQAAHAHRRRVGEKWRVDETYCRLNGRWAYCYRAIDQDGQVVDAYFTERRNAAAARTFFERAIAGTGSTPERVITNRARCYPPALRAVLPSIEHRCSRYLNNGLEPEPWPPQATAAVDARIQAACQRRHFLSGPRADPESTQRFLNAYRHSPAPLASPEGVDATSAGDLALT